MAFFTRRCSECHRLFGVKVVGRKLVDAETRTEDKTVNIPVGLPVRGNPGTPTYQTRHEAISYKRDTWEISFRCSKCGHTWTETKVSLQKD